MINPASGIPAPPLPTDLLPTPHPSLDDNNRPIQQPRSLDEILPLIASFLQRKKRGGTIFESQFSLSGMTKEVFNRSWMLWKRKVDFLDENLILQFPTHHHELIPSHMAQEGLLTKISFGPKGTLFHTASADIHLLDGNRKTPMTSSFTILTQSETRSTVFLLLFLRSVSVRLIKHELKSVTDGNLTHNAQQFFYILSYHTLIALESRSRQRNRCSRQRYTEQMKEAHTNESLPLRAAAAVRIFNISVIFLG